MFKKLEIKIPFFEALEHMHMYPQFMKDIISKKRTLGDEPVILIEMCGELSQGIKIPIKRKYLGFVTISCII